MTDLMTKSLAQIVTANHKTASVFEKYNLDFCCNGKRTLEQACREKAIDTNAVLADLGSLDKTNSSSGLDPIDFNLFSLRQLCEYIVNTHHSYVKKELPAITAYLFKVTDKHGGRHPELMKIKEYFARVSDELLQHMQKEELVLFPRISDIETKIAAQQELTMNSTYLFSPIVIMEDEHEHAGTLLSEIRELTGNYQPPADACTTFRLLYASLQAFEMDLHQHVHLENNILFPKALRMLSPTDQPSLN
jgi:regulator of cell morphogenesis and NO signaling